MVKATSSIFLLNERNGTAERSTFPRWLPSTGIGKLYGQTNLRMLQTRFWNCGASRSQFRWKIPKLSSENNSHASKSRQHRNEIRRQGTFVRAIGRRRLYGI